MPVRRKLRTGPARRRVMKRRFQRMGKWMVARAPKVHYFKELCQLASINVAPGLNQSGIITFKLTDILNSGSIVSLFDLYKITGVKLRLVPLLNVSDANTTNAAGQIGSLPMLYIAPNRDPFTPAAGSIADLLNDDGCRIIRLERPYKTYLKSPKPLLQDAAGTSLPFQLGTKQSQQFWLTTGGNAQTVDQSSTEHYGYRYMITNNSLVGSLTVQVYATLYFACKEQD